MSVLRFVSVLAKVIDQMPRPLHVSHGYVETARIFTYPSRSRDVDGRVDPAALEQRLEEDHALGNHVRRRLEKSRPG